MRHPRRGWWAVAATVALTAIGLWLRQHAVDSARARWGQTHDQALRAQALAAETARLNTRPKVPATDDAAALVSAKAEVADLERQLAKLKPSRPTAKRVERFDDGSRVAVASCRNVGQFTPKATLETLLWAAAGGDVDAFASGVALSSTKARNAARTLFDSLPAEARDRYGSPERMLAALTIADVPLGAVEVREWGEPRPVGNTGAQMTSASVLLLSPDGNVRQTTIAFIAEAGSWKLLANEAVIAKYADRLKNGTPSGQGAE